MSQRYKYWIDCTANNKSGDYYWHLRCPNCLKGFRAPKQCGMWKGCPICWIELKFKKGNKKRC